MAWIKLDDSFADHPKIVKVGPIAAIIQIRALCYAARHLTDGHIPCQAVPSLLTGFEHIGIDYAGIAGMMAMGADAIDFDWPAVLVEAGLWEQNGDSYLIHDYLHYNPSKTEVVELRKMKAKAGQAGGKASAQARAKPPAQPSAQAPAKTLLPPFGSELLNSPSPPLSSTSPQKEKEKEKEKEAPAQASAWKDDPLLEDGRRPGHRKLCDSPGCNSFAFHVVNQQAVCPEHAVPSQVIADKTWLDSLLVHPDYRSLNVRVHLQRAKLFLQQHPNQPQTRDFFTQWLNDALTDQPHKEVSGYPQPLEQPTEQDF